ncbi:MAG: hypothetical protein Q4B54_05675 [Coriobacteriales bacterium]|nr:hypothetical protein [Coriobacteriales bacterium]
MKKSLVNDELSITYPNAFRDMELTELQLLYKTTYKYMWGARDEKHHVMIAIIWKENNRFLQKLVSEKSLATTYEKNMRKAQAQSNYHLDGFFEREVAGQQAQGFGYSYETDGVGQQGEALVFRRDRVNYTLYYYTGAEQASSNRIMYQDVLESLAFA